MVQFSIRWYALNEVSAVSMVCHVPGKSSNNGLIAKITTIYSEPTHLSNEITSPARLNLEVFKSIGINIILLQHNSAQSPIKGFRKQQFYLNQYGHPARALLDSSSIGDTQLAITAHEKLWNHCSSYHCIFLFRKRGH